jgi:hypothetical protein
LQVTEKDVPGIVFQSRFEISRKNQPRAAELFKLWYLQQAEERIPQRAKYFAEALTQSAKTPTWKFCSPALKVLIQNGGTATLNEILTGLEVSLSQTLTDSDRKIMDSRGFPRWHQAVQRAYRQCQREGWIEKQKRRDGTWRITSKGRAVAEETEAAPAPR